MRTVRSLTKGAATAVMSGSAGLPIAQAPLGTVDDQTGDVVEKIFRQLQAIFPAWKQAWPDDKSLMAARRSWTKGFMAAGVNSLDQVKFGIEQCRKSGSPFAPSIGQFIGWCTPGPEAYGMPAASDAWMEALMGTASHEAVRIAANATGIFDLRSAKQDDKAMRARFDRNYQIVIRRAQAGEPLSGKILAGIGHDSQKSQLELADELADQQTQERIAKQGIPSDGASARAQLMAKFGKRAAQ
ncbi:replication protein P [Pseudomonas sp. CCI3.2]|uniref:replication protein P n=1 Tax=unclassified Pseudomonas TaxID=196821 RepID=UPI002B2249F9|nr:MULTISPECIES: replication protein P [unclassified Pseudomonas]MEB0078039.1 replication protein P [Pseudomonas sp. MH10out]MEB0104046.1 replication protein P [Pseudomonas sp. CCI3.2]